MSYSWNLTRVKKIIDDFDRDRFTPADVLRKYDGQYLVNKGESVGESYNAQFGRLCLSKHRSFLGIRKVDGLRMLIKDDQGEEGRVSVWEKVN